MFIILPLYQIHIVFVQNSEAHFIFMEDFILLWGGPQLPVIVNAGSLEHSSIWSAVMITIKRDRANKQNARKSTGPRSERGKEIVKRNAVKHGILSREVVIKTGEGKEDVAEFDQILSRLYSELKPKGIVEEMCIDNIASKYWRLRRVLRRENGAIQSQLDNFEFEELATQNAKLIELAKWIQFGDTYKVIKNSSVGINHLIDKIENAIRDIVRVGYVSKYNLDELSKYFKKNDNELSYYCREASNLIQKDPAAIKKYVGEKINNPKELQAFMIEKLQDEKKGLEEIKKNVTEKEKKLIKEKMSLPANQDLETLIRYENSLERGLYKALHELQRLQAYRLGIKTPLPLAVDITDDSNK